MPILSALTSLDLIAAISLTFFVLITTYITSFCFIAPIPRPTAIKDVDNSSFTNKVLFYYYSGVVVFLIGLYHAIICFTYPTPPSMLCPNPTNLSPQLFTWNIHTILCITSLLICGQVLLRSFIELGPSSNFQVEVPRQLVTTGLYSWAQHPSYTATFVIFLTNGAMILRRDGVAACWLQKSIVDGERLGMVLQTGYLFAAVVGGWMLATRVGDEEALLKTTFGTEWEVYHKRTKRFIPGII